VKDDHFLGRWSKRKHAAKRGSGPEDAPEPAALEPHPSVPVAAAAPAEPLPDVSTLTSESDFSPFMREGVDPTVKRDALKTLFQDSRFNVMDGLDVYIDDYSKPDPLPEGWLAKMNQVARLGEYREPDSPEQAKPEAEVAAEPGELTESSHAGPGDARTRFDTGAAGPNTTEVPESSGKPTGGDGQMV
jgi:hypothetical protein